MLNPRIIAQTGAYESEEECPVGGKVILPSLGKDFFTSVGKQFFA